MTVRLRSDRHPLFGPGFALLVFDRPIDLPRLEISILNTVTGLHLGPSAPGRANWGKQRTTFFPAIRAGGEGSSVYRVGPEVTTYIQEGTYVEIASADGSVREELSWEGVLLRVNSTGTENWTSWPEAFELGPDGPGADRAGQTARGLEEVRRDDREAIRQKQQEEERARAEQAEASAALARQQAEAEARRRAEEADLTQFAADEPGELAGPQTPGGAPETEDSVTDSAPGEPSKNRPRQLAKFLLGVLVVAAVVGGGYRAYRHYEGVSENMEFERVQDCVRAKGISCGIAACTALYRHAFPHGAHVSEIDRLDASGARACLSPVPSATATPSPTATPAPTSIPSTIPSPRPSLSPELAQIRRRTAADKPDTDCSRALKPIEQMLCYDGDLARVDGELGEVYRRKLAGTADKASLRADENAWIARRETECEVPPSGVWTEMQLRRSKNCILQQTRNRIDELNRKP